MPNFDQSAHGAASAQEETTRRCLRFLGTMLEALHPAGEQRWIIYWMGQEWHDCFCAGGAIDGLKLLDQGGTWQVHVHTEGCDHAAIIPLGEVRMDRFLVFARRVAPFDELPIQGTANAFGILT